MMEIVLLEDISNLGRLGAIVKVKPGYARNFLIPYGKAKKANAANLRLIAHKREALEKIQEERLQTALQLKEQLNTLGSIKIPQHAGVDGRLFGSVTSMKIIAELNRLGISLPKGVVKMLDGSIRTVGTHTVQIVLHADVATPFAIQVFASTDLH